LAGVASDMSQCDRCNMRHSKARKKHTGLEMAEEK